MDSLPRKCAVINDFSGFGRCSLAVALPVLSVMGVQCCSIPTAVLSNHTGYKSYFFDSFTNKMPDYISEWKKLNLSFDFIFSGFLGCAEQIDLVCSFIDEFKSGKVIVDPVMGDNGKIYVTYTEEMCKKMRILAEKADIITPNITEACILAKREYLGESITDEEAFSLLKKLNLDGKRSVVITGIHSGDKIKTSLFDSETGSFDIVCTEKSKITYPGTGDLFASILCGALAQGESLLAATIKAAEFVSKTAIYTNKFETDINDGIAFEKFLAELK